MMPLISVIVPVYNVVDYLERCVNSILAQTYTQFELIIVDDGSTDGSEDLCDVLATRDSRIICIHKENGGLSSARNAALDISKGEYITFVDSDDMIAPNALEVLIQRALTSDSDIVLTDSYFSFSDKDSAPKTFLIKEEKNQDNIQALQEVLCKSTRWEAWGHLFKSSLWSIIRFPQGKLYEDLATIPYVILSADKVTSLSTAIYYYFQRPGSIMRQSEQKVSLDLCYVTRTLIDCFKGAINDPKALSNICSGLLMELCSRTDLAAQNINNNQEFVASARKILKRHILLFLRSDYYSLKQKVYYTLESLGLHRVIYWIYTQK